MNGKIKLCQCYCTVDPDRRVFFASESHTFYDRDKTRIPSVTQVLKSQGIVTGMRFCKPADRERGHRVHELTALMDQGVAKMEDVHDKNLWGYLWAWHQFKEEMGWQGILQEQIVYSPEHNYAGIFDRIGVMHGELYIIDIKTGAHQRWHGLQLAAYAIAAGVPQYKRAIIKLSKDGNYSVIEKHRSIAPFWDPIWEKSWLTILQRSTRQRELVAA